MPCSCDRRGLRDHRVSIGHTSNVNSGSRYKKVEFEVSSTRFHVVA
ncbi:hypothetical protein Tco_0744108, partial [Tanacetum coccineum]